MAKSVSELLQDISTYITNKAGKIRKTEHGGVLRNIVETFNEKTTANSTSISAVETASEDADAILQSNIDSEEAARIAADDALQSDVDSKEPILGFTPENVANKGAASGYAGLDSGGKVPLANLPSSLLVYQGVWNASTNTPTLTTPDATKKGFVYIVGTPGTQFGIEFSVGDWAIYNDSGVIEKSDNSDDVVSVNGKKGVVVLSTDDIADVVNKRYVTDAEKAVLASTSGTNTGDETSETILNKIGDGNIIDENYLPDISGDIVEVSTSSELITAIGSSEVNVIKLLNEISLTGSVTIGRSGKTIIGHTLKFVDGLSFTYGEGAPAGDRNEVLINILAPLQVSGTINYTNIYNNLYIYTVYHEGSCIYESSSTDGLIIYAAYYDGGATYQGNGFVVHTLRHVDGINIENPGNNKYYGTNSSGEKGYHELPSGGTVNKQLFQCCNMGTSISGTNVHTYIAEGKEDNAAEESTTSEYTTYCNGLLIPFVASESIAITRASVIMGRAAVSQSTVGSSPTVRVAIYSVESTSRTLIDNIDVPITNISAVMPNGDMSGTTIVYAVLNLSTAINIPANTLWGVEVVSRNADNNEIYGFGRIQVTLTGQ